MRRILLVEDEAIIALAEKTDLETFGYEVFTVSSGEEAVAACEGEGRFDLVLMDIDLGRGLDGTAAAETILASREIPILFLSGHSEPEVVERTEHITSYGYIVKGSSPTVIDASIKMALKLFDAKHIFRAVLDANQQFICWKDRNSVFLGCNKNHAALFGLHDTRAIAGKTDWDLHRGEEEIKGFIRDDAEVMDSGTVRYRIRERALYPDGSERVLETNKVPLRDSRGEVSGIMIAYSDVSERIKDEERIRTLLEEKELIVRETQHRMKNDLTMIGSLLSLQSSRVKAEEARNALRDAAEGIRGMAVLYEKMLGLTDLREVSIKTYLGDFASRALARYPMGKSMRMDLELEDFNIPTKILRPLGMIVNEILTNAMKYAFEGRRNGTISIKASSSSGVARIVVGDDGIGLPDRIDFDSSPGFGLTMVRSLSSQLGGSISIERGAGTSFILEFPF
jgi:PAS domain S-box-containing protein